MVAQERLLNTRIKQHPDVTIMLVGSAAHAIAGEWLVETLNRALPGRNLPQVCYHAQMGRIESCDTCMVEVDGKRIRACPTQVAAGITVATSSKRADVAQREAFDRIEDHEGHVAEKHQSEREPPSLWQLFRCLRAPEARRELS